MSFLFKKLIRPALFRLDAERAHELGIDALKLGLARPFIPMRPPADLGPVQFGSIERFGLKFPNPLGVAAGFDKNAAVVDQLASLGFGFVEVGTVTFQPQKGNEKPRLFRLREDQALINRLGFNNEGAATVAERLQKIKRSCVTGVNIGKNKEVPNEEAAENYLKNFDLIHGAADYIAVNISSPNTPNLRELQRPENLEELIGSLQKRNGELSNSGSTGNKDTYLKPLLVKIAPDLSEAEIEMIVGTCLSLGVSGIIATNTTISREGLKTAGVKSIGPGGLSGKPLRGRSNEVVRAIFRHSKGKIPIIGVGGIFSGQDAFDKIAAGACLVQAYTGFIYRGPTFARDVNTELAGLMKTRGLKSLEELIGTGINS